MLETRLNIKRIAVPEYFHLGKPHSSACLGLTPTLNRTQHSILIPFLIFKIPSSKSILRSLKGSLFTHTNRSESAKARIVHGSSKCAIGAKLSTRAATRSTRRSAHVTRLATQDTVSASSSSVTRSGRRRSVLVAAECRAWMHKLVKQATR